MTEQNECPPASNEQEFEWELNRENIRPLRSGRHASSLRNLGTRPRVTTKEAQERFKDLFDSADNNADPLLPFYDYVCWFEENFPSGRQNILYPILWKIVQRFATVERYRNEHRILKLWFKLAEKCPERCFPVIAYAFDKQCCTKLAQFYIRWAELFDCCGDLDSARAKLDLGKKHLAEPRDDLEDAINQIEMRILRESLKRQQDSDDEEPFEETREVLGQLQGVGTECHAPIFRQSYKAAGKIAGLKRNTVIGKQGPDSFSIFTSDMENDQDFMELFGSLQFEHKQELGIINSDENKGILTKLEAKEPTIIIPTSKPAFTIFCDDPEKQRKFEEIYNVVPDPLKQQTRRPIESVRTREPCRVAVVTSKSSYKPPKHGLMQLKIECCIDSIEEVLAKNFG